MRAPLGLGLSLVLAALAPSNGEAQNWTSAQQAVLDRIDQCVQAAIDRNQAGETGCYHRDFSGWRNDMPGLRDSAFILAEIGRSYSEPQSETLLDYSMQPLGVEIYGSVAIVHYYAYFWVRPAGGEVAMRRSRWTDIMLNEGGQWVWIADHGGQDPGNPAPTN
jgi:hypothetical protein